MDRHARLLTPLVLAALLALFGPAATTQRKKSDQKFGVIAGTVFQQSGFSLRGARVKVIPMPADGSHPKKKDIKSTVSDSRGEFAVRVPAGAMRYTVRVEADGWQSAERVVVLEWDQRIDLSFRLKPAGSEGASK